MNFNLTTKKDYKLNASMLTEMINLYGIYIKLLLVDRVNQDTLVFGDYSHLKTEPGKSYELTALPENSDEWDSEGSMFSDFGLVNYDNIRLFVSRTSIDKIFTDFDSNKGFEHIIGNLIVLPNNKIMEISDIQFEVPGINNSFTNNDVKSAYKLSLVPYNMKLINEIENTEITPSSSVKDSTNEYSELNKYFDELTQDEISIDTEAEITINSDTNTPVIATDEDDVFGRF